MGSSLSGPREKAETAIAAEQRERELGGGIAVGTPDELALIAGLGEQGEVGDRVWADTVGRRRPHSGGDEDVLGLGVVPPGRDGVEVERVRSRATRAVEHGRGRGVASTGDRDALDCSEHDLRIGLQADHGITGTGVERTSVWL